MRGQYRKISEEEISVFRLVGQTCPSLNAGNSLQADLSQNRNVSQKFLGFAIEKLGI
jgi:hypothetical protein